MWVSSAVSKPSQFHRVLLLLSGVPLLLCVANVLQLLQVVSQEIRRHADELIYSVSLGQKSPGHRL